MDNPFFSVIIPVYNRSTRITKALDSLKRQNFQNFETIVVDDASTDDSYNVASKFPLQNKIVIKNKENSERCTTRNNGVALAKGEYICFLDSDDYHLENHLEFLYNYIIELGKPEAFIFTNSINSTEEGVLTERTCPSLNNYNWYTYLLRYTPNPQRWAVHRNIFGKIQFDTQVVIAEDMDFALRTVAAGFDIHHLDKVTTVYVAASDSFTQSDTQKAEKELKYFMRIFQKNELEGHLPRREKNRLLSMCYFYLAIKADKENKTLTAFTNAIKSFVLCPKGYNGKTAKILAVVVLCNLPIIGYFITKVKQVNDAK